MNRTGWKACMFALAGCGCAAVVSAHAPRLDTGKDAARSTPTPRSDRPSSSDKDAAALMKNMGDALRGIKSMTAEVSSVRWSLDAQGKPTTKAGEDTATVQMARPNLMRVKWSQTTILYDGASMWRIEESKKSGTRLPLRWTPVVAGAMPPFYDTDLPLQAQEVAAPIRLVGERKIEGQSYQVLEASGKAGLRRWFIGKDHLIHRTETVRYLPPGNREKEEVVYRNLKTNVPMDAEVVRFQAPGDFQIAAYPPNFDADDLTLKPGMKAPDLTLPTVDGKTLRLSDSWSGKKLTLLYIWNDNCGACHGTLPVLEALRKQYTDRGLNVLVLHEGFADYPSLQSKDAKYHGEDGQKRLTRDSLQRYMSDYDLHFTQAMIQEAADYKPYWCNSYPSVYFIDGKGTIVTATHAHSAKSFREVLVKSGITSAPSKDKAASEVSRTYH
jgi:peroxiredoxin